MTALTTPGQIELYRLITLRAALRLELHGMKRRGQSAYAIIKQEFNLKGTKTKVLEQYSTLLDAMLDEARSSGHLSPKEND